jgi:DNA-binding FadR family transcriptional regulator
MTTQALHKAARKFSRIAASPAYRRVAEAVERDILCGRLKAGEPLGTEAALVEQFGVNRSTIREGIRLLEHSGLVRRDSSRRLWVELPRTERLVTSVSRALVLHEVTFRELYDAALALQLATIDAAVEHSTPAEIDALERNIEATAARLGDAAEMARLDGEFHALVGLASHNRVLQLAREPSELLVISSAELILRNVAEAPARLVHAHRMYVDAMRRRDREAGRLWARRHLEDWRRGFERAGKDLDRPIDRIILESG